VSPALVLILLLSAGPHGGQAAPCWTSCQQHVKEAALRARVCQRCLTDGGGESWVLALGGLRPLPREALRSARGDSDWRVRWASVRAQARGQGLSEQKMLADWVVGAPPAEEGLACLTAVRAAAREGLGPADYFKKAGGPGRAAAARVQAQAGPLREALEVEVYAEALPLRGEALSHLATFLGKPPARVLLEAMARRPESADEVAASALLAVAERTRTSVGRMLLLEAKPADEALINRLFAVYSRELEGLQAGLASPEVSRRRDAVLSLRRYGPLAERELERAVGDGDVSVRRLAVLGLAEAEGLPVLEAAARRVRAPGEEAARRPWLEAASLEKHCEHFLRELAREEPLSVQVRGEALGWLAECEEGPGRSRFQELSVFLADARAPLRAGAVRALSSPRSPEGDEVVASALEDPAPEVVAAALEVVARHRQSAQGDNAAALLGSGHARVREAAARALVLIGRPAHVKALIRALEEDPLPTVRVAAVQALVNQGGPFAAAALSQAAARDPDTHVQHLARQGLGRLGFRR
jgi:HEAT repeat protein